MSAPAAWEQAVRLQRDDDYVKLVAFEVDHSGLQVTIFLVDGDHYESVVGTDKDSIDAAFKKAADAADALTSQWRG